MKYCTVCFFTFKDVESYYTELIFVFQVETESAKNIAANLERITADLKQMRQERAALLAQAQLKNKS